MFKPIIVNGGRKFKGRGFIVEIKHTYGPHYEMDVAKIWVPAEHRHAYANADYAEDDASFTQADIDAAFDAYTRFIIESTIEWCKGQKPNASHAETMEFARKILFKHHPDMATAIEAAIPPPDKNMLLDEEIRERIASTLAWAKTLRTKVVWMYGRYVGGKPYTPDRVVECARKALEKKGLAQVEDFNFIFNDECRKAGLIS